MAVSGRFASTASGFGCPGFCGGASCATAAVHNDARHTTPARARNRMEVLIKKSLDMDVEAPVYTKRTSKSSTRRKGKRRARRSAKAKAEQGGHGGPQRQKLNTKDTKGSAHEGHEEAQTQRRNTRAIRQRPQSRSS